MSILEWIDVGKVSAERDEQLSSYFFDNGVLNQVVNSPTSFLVLGRKGAGKTAVFRYLNDNPGKFLNETDLLVSLSFEDYNWNIHAVLKNAEAAESLAYRQSWRFVILVEVLRALISHFETEGDIPKKLASAKKLLEKLFDQPLPSVYTLIGRKILKLSKLKLPRGGLDLEGGDLDSIEVSGGEVSFDAVKEDAGLQGQISQNIENLIRYLERALEDSLQAETRVFITFDRIDEAWDEISIASSKMVIAGLISAADSITGKYEGRVRPIIFLREDIFATLSLNDANKLREDCGELLHWTRDSIFSMIMRRIAFFAEENDVDQIFSDIDDLFDKREMRQRARPSNYLLKRSMMRPRDLICILSRTIKSMKEEADDPFAEEALDVGELLKTDAIYQAEPGYSEWLQEELIDEWGVQKPEIRQLLQALQIHGSTNFTVEEFQGALNKTALNADVNEIISFLRFLFDNSVIGFKAGASTNWRFRCFYPTQGFVESSEYRVHDGLIRALNLKEPRDLQ